MTPIRVLINIVSVFYVGLCISKSLAYANNRPPADSTSRLSIYPYNDVVMLKTLKNICSYSECGKNVLLFDCQGLKLNLITMDRWPGSSGNELIGFHLSQSTYAKLTEKPTEKLECTYRIESTTEFRGVLDGFINTGSRLDIQEKTRIKPSAATRIGNRDSAKRLRGQSMFLSNCRAFQTLLKSLRQGNKKEYCFFF